MIRLTITLDDPGVALDLGTDPAEVVTRFLSDPSRYLPSANVHATVMDAGGTMTNGAARIELPRDNETRRAYNAHVQTTILLAARVVEAHAEIVAATQADEPPEPDALDAAFRTLEDAMRALRGALETLQAMNDVLIANPEDPSK